jgi:hypothetical protein
MYCPSCGSEISAELRYCNRCGANLTVLPPSYSAPAAKPMKLGLPAIVLGLTITIGLGIIFDSAKDLTAMHLPAAALTFMVIFGLATLFGTTALILRLWLKIFTMNRESYQPQYQPRLPAQMPASSLPQQQFPPRLEPMPSVTEHTTRTFSPAYREPSERGTR